MELTVGYLEERFAKYNELCFEGKLPPIPIVLSSGRRFLGKLEYSRKLGWRGREISRSGYLMRISTARDLTPLEVDSVVVHEMIHYWIAVEELHDLSAHGPLFRAKMKELNEKYGLEIRISHRSSEEELSKDNRVRQHFVAVSEFGDGKTGLTVCSEACAPKIARSFRWAIGVHSTKWYVTTNPWFNRFPHSRTAKLYKVDLGELAKALEGATAINNL